MKRSVNPNHLEVSANGLPHHVLEWTPAGPREGTAVLIHGFADAAATWDLVAGPLCEEGLRVLCPDMRGHGDGPRVPPGGYYHFPDYVADLADLVDALVDGPLLLVGHSMGGAVVSYYAGAFPQRPTKIALLEGIGPPDTPFAAVPFRVSRWIDGVRAVRARSAAPERRMTREEARRRLASTHTAIPLDVLDGRVAHLVREVSPGAFVWKLDPLHRTMSPIPYYARAYAEFARCVACPVLFVGGGSTGFHTDDEAERLGAFARLRHEELEGAGHMMHWTRPDALASLLRAFWRSD